MTIYKILGKRGRVTIPWEIRRTLGFAYNDVVSFEMDGSTVLIKREKICDGCAANGYEHSSHSGSQGVGSHISVPEPKAGSAALSEILNDLMPEELRTALIHLSVKWAEMQGGDHNA